MGFYDLDLSQTNQVNIFLETDYQENGWVIEGGKAVHWRGNSGFFRVDVFRTSVSVNYTLSFTVESISNGVVRYYIGGEQGEIDSAGQYTRVISSINESNLIFWSDADAVISNVVITDTDINEKCYIFNSDFNKFGGRREYYPEMMTSFLDSFFSFKNGELWKHNDNPIRNSFYGQVHDSEITFVFAPDHSMVKNIKNIRLMSNIPWEVSEIRVRPRAGKTNGQLSRISKERFRDIQGQWFADFLRDMNDPRFQNNIQALFEGAELQGTIIEMTIKTNSENEVRLSSVDVMYSGNMFSY